MAGHLNAVVNTPELREAYNAALPLVTEFSTWVGLHEGLYKQYQRRRRAGLRRRTPVRRRIVEMLRDFRLSGVELQGADRERYAAISDREAQASQKFSENVLDAIDAGRCSSRTKRAAGIPADVLAAARRRRGRRQAGLEADAENALLPAGDAVRPRPRPARGAVPRLWHRRVGTG